MRVRRSSAFSVSILLLMLLAVPSYAAETGFACSVAQGFKFDRGSQEVVGYIDGLKIGGQDVTADMDVTDATGKQRKVVGVVSGIQWQGGYSDPVEFAAQVSEANQQALNGIKTKALSKTPVVFSFSIYSYDPGAKSYYACFNTEGAVNGTIARRGGVLGFNVSSDPSEEVPSPKNYALQLAVMPGEENQQLHLGMSATNKWAKQWGIPVAP